VNSIIPNLMLIVVEINTTNTSTTLFNLIVRGSNRKKRCENEPRRDRIVKRHRLINAISDILRRQRSYRSGHSSFISCTLRWLYTGARK
jgi:predicted transcriptional regulator